MHILWLCNTPLPEMAQRLGARNYKEGWLAGISDELRKKEENVLTIVFPQKQAKGIIHKVINSVSYYGFYKQDFLDYGGTPKTKKQLSSVITRVRPDIIHIFGTEYPHCLEMLEIAKDYPVLISIQGLVSVYAEHYFDGIPFQKVICPTIFDGKLKTIYNDMKLYEKRGIYEKKALCKCNNVIGRTDWDKACVEKINPRCNYFKCNETMRNTFYSVQWNYENIDKYSIFVSQGNYPVKGLHYLLKALPLIKRDYPKSHVIVAGDSSFILGKAKTPYGKYIYELMQLLDIEHEVTFRGFHTEEKMCEEYLKANVMVMCSNIENSPNCIGEAMLVGTPIVASNVGGVYNLLEHGKEGFLYQHNASYMLAYYVKQIFRSREIAERFSVAGRVKAKELYCKEKNYEELHRIYSSLIF